MLLNAAKDVASALGSLINATKNASGKPSNDPAMEPLKATGKVRRTTDCLCATVTEQEGIPRFVLSRLLFLFL